MCLIAPAKLPTNTEEGPGGPLVENPEEMWKDSVPTCSKNLLREARDFR